MSEVLLLEIGLAAALLVLWDAWRTRQPHATLWALAVFGFTALALPAYAAVRLVQQRRHHQPAAIVQDVQEHAGPQ